MKLIAIVGMPGAGKTAAADFFRSKHIPVLRFGDETDLGLAALGKQLTELNERWYRKHLREELGMAAMAIRIEPRILQAAKESDLIVLDGLYSWEEYLYLKKKFSDLTLLCIWSTPAVRYQRLANRAVRPLTRQEAQSRDIAEIEELHKGGPIAIADHLVPNESDLASFQAGLEQFYSSIS